MDTLLNAEGITVATTTGLPIVDDVSLTVSPGEILGLVGESGSGKTTTGLALLGYTRAGSTITAGRVSIGGVDVLGKSGHAARGRLIAYVPQDPSVYLNPSMRVEDQLHEAIRLRRTERPSRPPSELLDKVELPATTEFKRRYPHQLSGGQQQRLAIAVALACDPRIVVLDEPTTGLDVVTQARVLAEIKRLCGELSVGMVYVSHDLAVVGAIADRVAVMYAGRIVEQAGTAALLQRPLHPYTLGLIEAIPDYRQPRPLRGIPGTSVGIFGRPAGCAFAARCRQRIDRCDNELPSLDARNPDERLVRCFLPEQTPSPRAASSSSIRPPADSVALLEVSQLRAVYESRSSVVVAAEDVAFSVSEGEAVAIVGESGSGKSTVARCIVGLHTPVAGTIALEGTQLAPHARSRTQEQRRRVQIVFQNPYDSLNPKHTVLAAVAGAARWLRGLSGRDANNEAAEALASVRLPGALAGRYPRDLSGGERQRVAIARALVAQPSLLVCDEITSSLDVSVQAAVLELIGELQRELGLALLMISHDLGVVASVADRVIVLERGRIREQGLVADVLRSPADAYTKTLIEAAPKSPSLAATPGGAA